MKKQLQNFSVVFAALLLMAGNAFSQLIAPVNKAEVPAIESGVMTIDGWADETVWSDEIAISEIFAKPADFKGANDLSGTMKFCWNNVGMYFFFKIKDDFAINFPGGDVAPHTFDNVELFFNFDTTGVDTGGSYRDDGIQMRYHRGYDDDDGIAGWGGAGTEAKAAGYDDPPTVYKQISNTSDWQVEILVPWLYILPSGTKPEDILDSIAKHKDAFGFEAALGDADAMNGTEGARDCMIAWDADGAAEDNQEDNAWTDTRTFGILSLVGTPITATPKITSSDRFDVYPNPVNNVLHFSNLNGATQITLINALGQTMKVVDVVSDNVVLPVSDLAPGSYVAIVKSENEIYTSKIVKK
jgi:hypothetical protein